jgi:hypothetical protein
MFIAWNAIAFENKEFLRDENGIFIPRNEFLESIHSALIFYLIKKDKALENSVKKHILSLDTKAKLLELAKDIKEQVFQKHPIEINLDEKIYLPSQGVKKRVIKRFDFQSKDFVEEFEVEVFKGVVEDFTIETSHEQLLKNALLSYAKALAEMEHKALKDTPLEKAIIEVQNLIANEWQNSLRLGRWTSAIHKGDLLFFWRVKELREKLLKEFHIDIRPQDTFYIPSDKTLVGWSEIVF